MTEHVVAETSNNITTLTLNRTEKKNALTQAMYAALTEALNRAEADDNVHAVRIVGAGDDFTAGNDLNDFREAARYETSQGAPPIGRFLHAVVEFRKPLVAQVHGNAIGIGATMLLHCDLVVAASDARFAMPFVALGVVPEFASSRLLPELVGRQRAARMLMLGEPFDARAAERFGLVTEVAEPDALEETTLGLCARLAAMPPGALQATRELLRPEEERRHLHQIIDREWGLFRERLATVEHREAVEAFFTARKS
jgi:enoyl-CoA hydratase/carnithine racemase